MWDLIIDNTKKYYLTFIAHSICPEYKAEIKKNIQTNYCLSDKNSLSGK